MWLTNRSKNIILFRMKYFNIMNNWVAVSRPSNPVTARISALALILATATPAIPQTIVLPFGEKVRVPGELIVDMSPPRSRAIAITEAPDDRAIWLISTAHPPVVLEPGEHRRVRVPWVRNTRFLTEPAGPELLTGRGPLPGGFRPETSDLDRVDTGASVGNQATPSEILALRPAPLFETVVDRVGGKSTVTLSEPIEVTPGKTYLFRVMYQVREWSFGNGVTVSVEVRSQDATSYHQPVHFLEPRYTGPDEWVYASVRFTAPDDVAEVQVRLGAENTPSRVAWAAASLREAPTPLMQLPESLTDRDEPPVLTEAQVWQMLAEESPRAAEIKKVLGQPVIHVDGEPVGALINNPNFYSWDAGYPNLANRLAREAGVRIHQVTLSLGDAASNNDPSSGRVWFADGKVDFAELDRRIIRQLQHTPDALLRLNIATQTYYGFGDDYPDAVFTTHDGKRVIGWEHSATKADVQKGDEENYAFSYASATMWDKVGQVMRQMGQHLAESDVGKRVVGLHLAGGSDGQWIATLNPHAYRDVSPEQVQGFRGWLAQSYATDAELQAAWADPSVTLATARQLIGEQIKPSPPQHWFLDIQNGPGRRLYDSNRFQSESKAQTIIHLAECFDAGFRRGSVITTYWSDVMHGHALDHWALEMLLDSEHVDGLISIAEYGSWRDPGAPGGLSSAAGSFRLRNKLFINEADFRTPLSWFNADALDLREYLTPFTDPRDIVHTARRDWGHAFTLGHGGWYYALSGPGWADPAYVDFFAEATRVAQRLADDPAMDEDRPLVATFADEKSNDAMTQADEFGIYVYQHGHNFARIPLSLSGLGYEPYLLPDVTDPDLPAYPIYVFLSANTMTEAQLEAAESLQRDGNVLVFIHAAGASSRLGLTETLRRLTGGITVRLDSQATTGYHYRRVGDDPLAEQVDHLNTWTPGPVLYVDNAGQDGVVALAEYPETGRVGAAVKRHDDWTAVYLAAPGGLTPRLLRNLAAEAGVRPVGPENDATFVGNRMVVLHSLTNRGKTIRWPEPADLIDLSSDEVVVRNATEYTFELPVGETRWFRWQPVTALPKTSGTEPRPASP